MSGVCREVVTLQLGHYSNFVGTHWWNLQDASLSYDPDAPPGDVQSDVVFREGRTLGGSVTYTPRLIAVDLNGSLRTLRPEGSLYDVGTDASALTWDGNLMTHRHSPPAKNPFLEDLDKLDATLVSSKDPFSFLLKLNNLVLLILSQDALKGEILDEADFPSSSQSLLSAASGSLGVETVNSQLARVRRCYKLEGSVTVWSDFLRIHLHPRTVAIVHQYNHNGETHRLEAFGQGQGLLQGSLLEELEDKLHFFVEECDYFQGFQVLCDLADGFAGLGSKVTEMLLDSYEGKGILTWGLAPVSHPNPTAKADLYHMLNCTLGTVHLANHSSLFCPLTLRGGLGIRPASPVTFPHLDYDPSLWYHSSAVLALALDALTAPYRLRNNGVHMRQPADELGARGRKVVAAYGALPFPMMHGSSLPDALSACAEPPWRPLSACSEPGDGCCYAQLVTLKGLEGQKLISSAAAGTAPASPLHGLDRGEDVLAAYVASFYPATPLALHLVSDPSKLTPPFPQIFSRSLSDRGLLRGPAPAASSPPSAVSSAPIMTSLQSGPAVGRWLSELRRGASGFGAARLTPGFFADGSAAEEHEEAMEELRRLVSCYWDDSGGVMSSDEDEDDD